MELTREESLWVRLLGALGVFILGFFMVRQYLPGTTPQPLADPNVLSVLIAGKPLPVPTDDGSTGQFHGDKILPPPLASLMEPTRVLGATSGDKHIEVDLTNQKVYAFEGSRKVYEFTISSGKWYPTPTGEFTIWAKVRSTKMEGGDRAAGTYYNLPNVPYVMFFSGSGVAASRGFSLHGTYWHNNFGHPMSHGCVNMKISDAQTLYEWADPPVTDAKAWSTLASAQSPGTRIVIYGQAPKE